MLKEVFEIHVKVLPESVAAPHELDGKVVYRRRTGMIYPTPAQIEAALEEASQCVKVPVSDLAAQCHKFHVKE